MATVISTRRGQVVIATDPGVPAQLQAVNVAGWGGGNSMNAIITRCTVSQQGNFQFLHTLGNYIYVYVFGDRMGQMSLSGLAFQGACGPNAKNSAGITNVLQFYNANRIAGASGKPVQVTLATNPTLQGFLTGGSCDLSEPYDLIWQFDFQFSLIPPQN